MKKNRNISVVMLILISITTQYSGCKSSNAEAALEQEKAAQEEHTHKKSAIETNAPKKKVEKKEKEKKRVFKAFEVNPDEPCDHCEKRFCTRLNGEDFIENCYEGEDGEVCKAVVDCAEKTKCAKNLSADCYCGEGISISQCMTGGAGPCKAEIEAASLVKDPSIIAVRFADPKYPIGRAMALIDCKRSYCPKCNEADK